MERKICKCGNPTRNEDGVCFSCKDEAAAKNKTKTIVMPKKEAKVNKKIDRNKVCPACNTRADSNRQDTCKRCNHVFQKKKKVTSTNAPNPRSSSDASLPTGQVGPLPEKSRCVKERQKKKKAGVSHAPSGDTVLIEKEEKVYLVSVDFAGYPRLHTRLLKLAEQEFREPGMQLLSLVHGTLNDLEAQA